MKKSFEFALLFLFLAIVVLAYQAPFWTSTEFLTKLIVGAILIVIVGTVRWLFNDWKTRVLAKEREEFTYSEVAEDFERWNGYVNWFVEGHQRLTKKDFDNLTKEAKIERLTEYFGANWTGPGELSPPDSAKPRN